MSIRQRHQALVFRAAVGDRCRYIVITTSSFSKALGGFGGAITGPTCAINEIRARGRRYVFAAALSPPTTAAALAALDLVFTTSLMDRLWDNRPRFVGLLATAGLAVRSPTPVVPLVLGDHVAARDAARALLHAGILALPLGPPVTPPGAARIRFVITVSHTGDDLVAVTSVVETFAQFEGTTK